jgi:N-acetylmuramoyl-L-alanine amidase
VLAFSFSVFAEAFPQRPMRPGETKAAPALPSSTNTPSQGSPKFPRTEWVSAGAFASKNALSLDWSEGQKRFQLKDRSLTLSFEIDSRECDLDGQRCFLGEAVRLIKGQPSFPKIDAEKLLLPFIKPGQGMPRQAPLRTIVIDPGHGGNDSGMINRRLNLQEKVLTLDTAQRLKKLLEVDGYRVVLTRRDDRYIELPDRAAIADKVGADLFVSIHFNSVEQGAEKVTGVEVFTMTPQYQLSTDQKPDPQFAHIANPGNSFDHWSLVLASKVHGRLLRGLAVPDRGLKRGRLAVLRLAPCPAVLVESGYLSHDAEARKLATPEYRQRIAEAIAKGVRDYSSTFGPAHKQR